MARYRNYCLLDELRGLIRVCIVLPTYNESMNIENLLDSIYSDYNKKKYYLGDIQMNVLVVDDNSPDKTAAIVSKYQKRNPLVHLLLRKDKEGLGAAYIHGMKYAMDMIQPHIIFEMDADLSHQPKYLLPMIEKIRDGAEFVIGSRYVKGGAIPKHWGIVRTSISGIANFYARSMLGLKDVHDCTGGFRAIRASLLMNINLKSLNVKGYAFQISLLHKANLLGATIEEVPIEFIDRTEGVSKMRYKDIMEVGKVVFMMSLNKRISYWIGNRPLLMDKRRQVEKYLIRY
jgi:dolichol-phosphate mannosyltransferase